MYQAEGGQDAVEKQHNSDESECFSSFDSNQEGSSHHKVDENGFRVLQYHREKDIAFPPVPSQLPKLYQIYDQNLQRRKKLKDIIDQFIKKQIRALRMKYDEETSAIEEYIDVEEQSREYELSKQKYEERESELQKLSHRYRELKDMHVEGLMKNDEKLMSIFKKFVTENRSVVGRSIHQDYVYILSREKVGHKGNRKNLQSQRRLNPSYQEKEETLISKEERKSVTSSEDENDNRYKWTIRAFQFYQPNPKKSEDQEEEERVQPLPEVGFQPMEKYFELPSREYTGLTVQHPNKLYIVHTDLSFTIIPFSLKNFNNLQFIRVDSRIMLCEVNGKHLYIGTVDGMMRVYEIVDGNLLLQKVVGCTYQQNASVTHFCLTANPDIVLFVEDRKKLCEMNLATYSGYLLSELPEEVLEVGPRIISTRNLVYKDYYIASSTRGKVWLQHNQKLKEMMKGRNGECRLVTMSRVEGLDYVIIDEGNGSFAVKQYENSKK